MLQIHMLLDKAMKEKLLAVASIIYILILLALILGVMFMPEGSLQNPVLQQIKEERMIQ